MENGQYGFPTNQPFGPKIEWFGPSSLATGGDTQEVVFPSDFNNRILRGVQVRLQTPSSSGSFTIKLEISTVAGVFAVAQTSDVFTITANNYEAIVNTFATIIIANAGNKMRFNITALGTGPANLTVLTEWSL